ncbi:MAG: HNH endonuclease [Selenomonadaceae bacterium]|nr:HNH endonuclease [Selenomonadaceae bacterium]
MRRKIYRKDLHYNWEKRRAENCRPAYDALMKFYPFTLEDLEGEQWEDIPNYEGIYQISTFGRVKSFCGGVCKILKPQFVPKGYLRIELNLHGKAKKFFIHCLVARTFIPNPENKPQANHRDGVKLNCHVSNLEWATGAENQRHALQIGLRLFGEEHPDAKLTEKQVVYIRENPDGFSQYDLATRFGVAQPTIGKIQLGEAWRRAGGIIRKLKKQPPRIPDNIREEIRQLYSSDKKKFGASYLARRYGIDRTTVYKIVKEK